MEFYKTKKILALTMCLLISLGGCNGTQSVDAEKETKKTVKEVSAEETKIENDEKNVDNEYEEYFNNYINTISNIEGFEPYYKTVFAFENVNGNIADVPIEKVNAMYQDMKTTFDYTLISQHFLSYVGDYNKGVFKGETKFVDGYEDYVSGSKDMEIVNPINYTSMDWEEKAFIETSIKSIQIGDDTIKHFEQYISEGRNFDLSDFTLNEPQDTIKVLLGSGYKELYKVGDIFSLGLISKQMNFEVIGFCKSESYFMSEIGVRDKISLDNAIIMPHIIFEYKAESEAEAFQHGFLTGEKMSGYIRINKPIIEIDEATYNEYLEILEKMASKNGVSNLYNVPYLPVGFVW